MLSNEKIKWMTRAALYEKKEGKGSIRINRFQRSDYISWNMIKSIVGVTVGYALVLLLYLLGISESVLDQLTLPYVVDMAGRFLFVYFVLLVVTGFVSFLIYYGRYQQAQKKTKMYTQYLKKISHIYQKEGEGAKGDYLS